MHRVGVLAPKATSSIVLYHSAVQSKFDFPKPHHHHNLVPCGHVNDCSVHVIDCSLARWLELNINYKPTIC